MPFDLLAQYLNGQNAGASPMAPQGPSVTPTPMPTPSPIPMGVPEVYPSGTPSALASNEAIGNPYASGLMDKGGPPAMKPGRSMAAPQPQSLHVDEPPPESTSVEPGPDELDQYKVTPEDLQDANRQRMAAKMISGLGNIFANQQSAGNYYLHQMAPKTDVADFSDLAGQNVRDKQTLYKQAVQSQQDKAKAASTNQQMELQKQLSTPGSPMAQLNATTAARVASKAGIPLDPKQLAGMSFAEQQEVINKNPLLKDAISEDATGKRLMMMTAQNNIRNDALERRLAQGDQRLSLASDKQGSAAGLAFETAVKPYKTVMNSLDRSSSIINGNEPVTAKDLALAQQDYIGAMAQGGAATEGKMNREMVHDIPMQINELKQKFGETADLRQSDPQAVNHLRSMINNAHQEWQKTMQQQVKDTGDAYGSSTNQKVKDVVASKIGRYVTPESGSPQMADDDKQALDWAKKNKGTAEAQQILLKISKKYPGAK